MLLSWIFVLSYTAAFFVKKFIVFNVYISFSEYDIRM